MKILLLVDAESTFEKGCRKRVNWAEPGLMESCVLSALTEAGHSVRVLPANRLPDDLVDELKNRPADLVFNLTLHWQGDRRRAVQVACLLETLEIPYTGSGPQGILRACDKVLSKRLVRSAGFRVPDFISVEPSEQVELDQFRLPAIVKPRFGGGSEGVTDKSLVQTAKQLKARVAGIHRRFCQTAVCEEFVEGRELSVGVFGNNNPVVFPIRERVFPRIGEGGPQFACRRIKTDAAYRDFWGIHWERAEVPSARAIQEQTVSIFKELQLRDYARIDYRLSSEGEAFFLEANHSPDCAPHSFGMFAKWVSCDYGMLVEAILGEALYRCGLKRTGVRLIDKARRLRKLASDASPIQSQP